MRKAPRFASPGTSNAPPAKRQPMRQTRGPCCARAASGHAACRRAARYTYGVYKENKKPWDDCQACRFGQKAEIGQGERSMAGTPQPREPLGFVLGLG